MSLKVRQVLLRSITQSQMAGEKRGPLFLVAAILDVSKQTFNITNWMEPGDKPQSGGTQALVALGKYGAMILGRGLDAHVEGYKVQSVAPSIRISPEISPTNSGPHHPRISDHLPQNGQPLDSRPPRGL
jgi:hypothetical protein